MDEWAQDLATALESSSLKQETDDQGDLSAADMRLDRDNCRKRRMRKRRTASTNSHLVTSLINNIVAVNQMNKSPGSSSSLDEAVIDYVESFTANCSDETDECANSWKMRLKNSFLSSRLRVHHKRVFKQARPCYCESDSHTENIPVIPRRHRKKKLKRMTVDNNGCLLQDSQGPTSGSCDEGKRRKQPKKLIPHPSEGVILQENMCCEPMKIKKENKTTIDCLSCYRKSCDKLSRPTTSVTPVNGSDVLPDDSDKLSSKHGTIATCQCSCHTNLIKDESSISASSSNSDTDSANFTPDDIGGDGDDEMTDFYAETDGGPVLGIPECNGLPWQRQSHGIKSLKNEAAWSHGMNGLAIGKNPYICDVRLKRLIPGTMNLPESSRRGFHARHNRLPGLAARSIRRARRRPKVKKAKEKNLREQDVHSLSKLSLSARSKRIRLEASKDAMSNRQEWPPHMSFCPVSAPQLSFTKSFETIGRENDMDILEDGNTVADDAGTKAS